MTKRIALFVSLALFMAGPAIAYAHGEEDREDKIPGVEMSMRERYPWKGTKETPTVW